MKYFDINMADVEYIQTAKKIMKFGVKKEDRTGTGTISLFGPQMEFDLEGGFPLLTTKKLPFRIIAEELLWFLRGDTNLKSLLEKNVHIWNDDAYRWHLEKYPESTMTKERFIEIISMYDRGNPLVEDLGDLGPIYGLQWTNFNGQEVNQLNNIIQELRVNPDSRRLVVSAWNPVQLSEMALPPCHTMFQFFTEGNRLSLKMYQRSGDWFLGIPFNIASYSLLLHIVAKMVGLEVGRFIHTLGDAHIYLDHVEQLHLQMSRIPKKLPTLTVKTVHEKIEDYTIDDFELEGYEPHPIIRGRVSVGLDKNTTK